VSGFDGLKGGVLGTSDPAATAGNELKPVRFIFPGGISLIPGATYVARISSTNGTSAPGIAGISITTNNTYKGGQLSEVGFSDTSPVIVNYDAVFQEGTVPEVPPIWLLASGLAIIVGKRSLTTRVFRSLR
jgi:hypothetical protein